MTTTESSTRRADAAVLRRIWRLHFWVGLFAAPVLVMLACSGLVILYGQPLDALLNRHLLVVEPGPQTVPLDTQVATAKQHVAAGDTLEAVTRRTVRTPRPGWTSPPRRRQGLPAGRSRRHPGVRRSLYGRLSGGAARTIVGGVGRLGESAAPDVRQRWTAYAVAVAGPRDQSVRVSAIDDPGGGIGNLWMELTATWILVLLASGIYLWWPRAIEAAKPLLTVRWRQGGRPPRWRDVHAPDRRRGRGDPDLLHPLGHDLDAVLGARTGEQ